MLQALALGCLILLFLLSRGKFVSFLRRSTSIGLGLGRLLFTLGAVVMAGRMASVEGVHIGHISVQSNSQLNSYHSFQGQIRSHRPFFLHSGSLIILRLLHRLARNLPSNVKAKNSRLGWSPPSKRLVYVIRPQWIYYRSDSRYLMSGWPPSLDVPTSSLRSSFTSKITCQRYMDALCCRTP